MSDTISRESALALIAEANRWQAAYNRVCNELADLREAATEYRRMVEAPPALNADEHEDWQASMQAADLALHQALGDDA